MPSSTPGVDRITLARLRAAIAQAHAAIIAHREQCATCASRYNWPARACDHGWELAKVRAAAERDLRDYTRPPSPPAGQGQEALW